MSFEKGIPTLLKVFARHPEWNLKVVGTGPLENQLKSEYKLWVPEPSSHLKNSTFKSKFHVHRLPYIETIERGGWLCNVCRESHKVSEKSYYCTLCDYDLCKNCKENEEKEIMNKF